LVALHPGDARRRGGHDGVRLERRARIRDRGLRGGAHRTGPAGPGTGGMTVTSLADIAPHHLAPGRGGGGPAPTRIVVAYGFWIFLLSDIILFSGLFAAYAVLATSTARGPSGQQLCDLNTVFI